MQTRLFRSAPVRCVLALLLAVSASGCEVGVNKDVAIAAGERSSGAAVINGRIDVGPGAEVTGELSTVNGRVNVDRDAAVAGINTVNGPVTLGPGAGARSINTVNGDVTLGESARVEREIELVNGDIRLGIGAEVGGDLGAVSGSIRLRDARVGGDVTTVSADVTLSGSSVIAGRLRVDRGGGMAGGVPRIIIGPGSLVEGVLEFEDDAEVYVSEDAEIGGVEGVLGEEDIVRFAGPEPTLQ
ncbi:DUF4097 family beta strand repeat-containing protein [Lentisalinibacter orientalis]|uniref:hypothetical protein n=1 Tax=Lentisalinibacter orientalis TaxID=2992241 RepID=UPI003863B0AE